MMQLDLPASPAAPAGALGSLLVELQRADTSPEAFNDGQHQRDAIELAPLLADLPRETRDDAGRLRCRHHPEEVIARSAAPCSACWRAARGIFGPLEVEVEHAVA